MRVSLTSVLLLLPSPLLAGGEFEPGKVSTIKSGKLDYAIRVPKKRNKRSGNKAIVFLHGSNMRGENYAWSLETASSLRDWVLIAPSGPLKVNEKAHNHNPGDEKYVASVIEDVQKRLKVKLSRIYVGGHSQGGFLSHAVAAHLPDKIDGVLACSGGSWVSPRKLLRKGKGRGKRPIPVAIVHAQDDPVVGVGASVAVYDAYVKAKHADVRLFIPKNGAHMFMRLPILDAIQWLELMNEDKRSNAAKALAKSKPGKDPRTAWDAAKVLQLLSKGKRSAKATATLKKITATAKKLAKDLATRIRKTKGALTPDLKSEAWSFLGSYGMVDSAGAWRKAFAKALRRK